MGKAISFNQMNCFHVKAKPRETDMQGQPEPPKKICCECRAVNFLQNKVCFNCNGKNFDFILVVYLVFTLTEHINAQRRGVLVKKKYGHNPIKSVLQDGDKIEVCLEYPVPTMEEAFWKLGALIVNNGSPAILKANLLTQAGKHTTSLPINKEFKDEYASRRRR